MCQWYILGTQLTLLEQGWTNCITFLCFADDKLDLKDLSEHISVYLKYQGSTAADFKDAFVTL